MITFLVSVCLAVGLFLLWRAWADRKAMDPILREAFVVGAWLSIFIGLFGWGLQHGDRGVATAIVITMAGALGIVIRFGRKPVLSMLSAPPAPHSPVDANPSASNPSWGSKATLVLLAGPLSLITALSLGLSSMRVLETAGLSEADRISITFFSVPLLWAAAILFSVIGGRAVLKIPVLLFLCALASTHIATTS